MLAFPLVFLRYDVTRSHNLSRYGDIIPKGLIGRLISFAWMIVGLVMTSVFISTLSAAITVSSINNDVIIYSTKVMNSHF